MTEESTGVARRGIQKVVTRYLMSHAGDVVYRDNAARELGLSESQFQAAVNNIIRRTDVGRNVEVVDRGYAWRYRKHVVESTNPDVTSSRDEVRRYREAHADEAARAAAVTPPHLPALGPMARTRRGRRVTAGSVLEVVGVTHDGGVIVKDEDDRLYRLAEL